MLARILQVLIAAQLLLALYIALTLQHSAGWSTGWSALAGLLVAATPHAALITLDFLLSRRFASPLPAGLAPAPLLPIWWRELRDSVRAFNLRQAWYGNRPLASAAEPGREGLLPVLFIHGYFCNQALWRPMAADLAKRGHVIDSVNLEPVFGSIDRYVDLIEQGVARLRARTAHDQVALVCHSMGGLAARAYLRRHGDLAVARVVTIGTPHRGTRLASFGLGRNVRQMRLDSEWLKTLAESETADLRRMFTIILSHHDNIVAPQSIQVLPDASVITLDGIGHISMASDPGVIELVAARLKF